MTKLAGNKNASTWAPAHTAMLRELVSDGVSFFRSAIEINERFNTSYTRNATVGKAHRIKLKAVYKQRQEKTPEKPRHRPGRYKPGPQPQHPIAAPYVPHCDEIGVLTLLEVVACDGCRWPSGDGPIFHFCGAPKFDGTSYCPWHAGAAVRHDVYVRRAG